MLDFFSLMIDFPRTNPRFSNYSFCVVPVGDWLHLRLLPGAHLVADDA